MEGECRAPPTVEAWLGSAEHGTLGCPGSGIPRWPRPHGRPLAAAAVAMRCCETPVNKPCLDSGARAQGLFAQWLEVQKSALSRCRRLQALPLPGLAQGPDARRWSEGAGRFRARRGARLLRKGRSERRGPAPASRRAPGSQTADRGRNAGRRRQGRPPRFRRQDTAPQPATP